MSMRVAALVFALLAVACTPSSDEAPPIAQMADRPALTGPVVSVPTEGWHAMLVAGDDSSPAFDNAIDTLRERLSSLGVHGVRAFTAGRTGDSELATSTNVRNGLRTVGGD